MLISIGECLLFVAEKTHLKFLTKWRMSSRLVIIHLPPGTFFH